MNREEFRNFIAENAAWFRREHRETAETFRAAEERLGIVLSEELKWLLTEWGYNYATGLENLEESVAWTLAVRDIQPDYPMPHQFFLLHDWQDAGYVLMDTATINAEGEPRVLWVAGPPCENDPPDVVHAYATFADWSVYLLQAERDFYNTIDPPEAETTDTNAPD